DVSWPGPRYLSRPALLAVAMIAWLSSSIGATPAQAAGCHVPERAVLGSLHSWERHGRRAAWEWTDEVPMAPQVLKKGPCPGEVPHVPVMTIAPTGAALPATADLPPPLGVESLRATDDFATTEPHAFRYDRPPR